VWALRPSLICVVDEGQGFEIAGSDFEARVAWACIRQCHPTTESLRRQNPVVNLDVIKRLRRRFQAVENRVSALELELHLLADRVNELEAARQTETRPGTEAPHEDDPA
jgi:hypothetical protein